MGRNRKGGGNRGWRRYLKRVKFREQGGLCFYCRRRASLAKRKESVQRPDLATLDHIVPLARDPHTNARTTVMACHECNTRKGLLTGDEFFAVLRLASPSLETSHER